VAWGSGAVDGVVDAAFDDIWPWMLTPLTARVMGAIFALATVGIAAFRYRRWSGMQILLQVEGLMLVLIVVALVRARDDFAASRPRQAAAVGETRAGRRAVQQGDALASGGWRAPRLHRSQPFTEDQASSF
jgi:hypothetical protein